MKVKISFFLTLTFFFINSFSMHLFVRNEYQCLRDSIMPLLAEGICCAKILDDRSFKSVVLSEANSHLKGYEEHSDESFTALLLEQLKAICNSDDGEYSFKGKTYKKEEIVKKLQAVVENIKNLIAISS